MRDQRPIAADLPAQRRVALATRETFDVDRVRNVPHLGGLEAAVDAKEANALQALGVLTALELFVA